MKSRAWIPVSVLLLLLAATAAGWRWTREIPVPPAKEGAAEAAAQSRKTRARPERLVDQTPLLTARGLAALATTLEEQELAHQAERVANHEVDLAFTDALRRAANAKPAENPEVKALAEAKAKIQAEVDADQLVIKRLTAQLATGNEARKEALIDQLDVAKAQLELDEDELTAAAEDLARVGGDPQARIRRLKEAHEAADRDSAQALAAAARPSSFQSGSLLARISEWSLQRKKSQRLEQARLEAQAKMQTLGKVRERISARVEKEKEDREAAKYWASNLVKESAAAGGGPGRDQAKDAVSYLKQYGDAQRSLSDIGRRIQDQQELSYIYGNWRALVEGYRITALHAVLGKALLLLALLLVTYGLSLLVDQLFHRVMGANKGAGTLRVVTKLVIQIACLLAILFLSFGMPAQTTTVLGLAGAGLTVALKDFIVAFFGWFILMGRNGIRVGDWVEIRGVGGEVVEIGLLRTVLLETGSWTDAGHPTGRRVAFVNSFAIEGHFFNFTSSGQWMWDELKILVPTGIDPYPVLDGLQKVLEEQTEANARLAENEWKQATARYRVQALSAVPSLNMVPTANGIEIRARYITRANERHDIRLKLNQAVVSLMHGSRTER
ncbi:MAG TPA: mechanosensitive ion channel domain-containing protein [Geothrix sp.]|nr:mechanosensitive ion channel domain-containing protein [Geothrix sp.]